MIEDPELERKMTCASALKKQCKKHQIFGEKAQEAEKMAEAGFLHAQIGHALKDVTGEHVFHYQEAATCLARAKRLCRDILREKP